MNERVEHNYQPTIPGLDGPEWESPQPELPLSDALTDNDIRGVLDSLHTSINNAEQAGEAPALIDQMLYEQLTEIAVIRGLEEPSEASSGQSLESAMAEVSESLNNPQGMTDETRQELAETLADLQAEYHEQIR